jgi:hypothetical protein
MFDVVDGVCILVDSEAETMSHCGCCGRAGVLPTSMRDRDLDDLRKKGWLKPNEIICFCCEGVWRNLLNRQALAQKEEEK